MKIKKKSENSQEMTQEFQIGTALKKENNRALYLQSIGLNAQASFELNTSFRNYR